MVRFDRLWFLAFGLLPLLDVLALLLYGLQASTAGRPGEGGLIPAILVLSALYLLLPLPAIVRRGRDLGLPALRMLPGFAVAVVLTPLLPVLLAFLALAPTRPGASALGPPAPRFGLFAAVFCTALLALPWLILRLLLAIG